MRWMATKTVMKQRELLSTAMISGYRGRQTGPRRIHMVLDGSAEVVAAIGRTNDVFCQAVC